jgi:hypothetical protein
MDIMAGTIQWKWQDENGRFQTRSTYQVEKSAF